MEKDDLIIFCDGGARGNPGPAGIGVLITNSTGEEIGKISQSIGDATNNQAEYKAVISSLKFLISCKIQAKSVLINLDSQLVYHQLLGTYRVKKGHLQNLLLEIKILEQQIKSPIHYRLVPREKNMAADILVNQALDRAGY